MKNKQTIFMITSIGVFSYLLHTLLGNILWETYNPITTDISTLTSNVSPYQVPFTFLTSIYALCMIILGIALIKQTKDKNNLLQAASIIFLVMQLVSFLGYLLFPLDHQGALNSFHNTMHLIVTFIVVFSSISYSYLFAFGSKHTNKSLFKTLLLFAILITSFGLLNPIIMNLNLPLLGLTERLVIYTLLTQTIYLSYHRKSL